MNWKQCSDSIELHFTLEINTNEILLEDLSTSLDSVTKGVLYSGFPMNLSAAQESKSMSNYKLSGNSAYQMFFIYFLLH